LEGQSIRSLIDWKDADHTKGRLFFGHVGSGLIWILGYPAIDSIIGNQRSSGQWPEVLSSNGLHNFDYF